MESRKMIFSPSAPVSMSTIAPGTCATISSYSLLAISTLLLKFIYDYHVFLPTWYPCSILTLTGGGGASGTLKGNPGPLAGAPTSERSGILTILMLRWIILGRHRTIKHIFLNSNNHAFNHVLPNNKLWHRKWHWTARFTWISLSWVDW